MKYPERHKAHKIETKSWAILKSTAPDIWVVREASERDYGIDAYIEIENQNGEITGEIFSAQLKGTEKIEWKNDQTSIFSGIETKTINYWMGLPMPVFLFVADINVQEVYFCSVRQHVRRNYDNFLRQKSFGFQLSQFSLSSDIGRHNFETEYLLEKEFAYYLDCAVDIISRWQEHWDFILSNQNRDCFLEVEDDTQLQMIQFYKRLCFLANLHDIEWSVEGIDDAFSRDMREWKNDYQTLHEQTINDLLVQIKPLFIEIVDKTVLRISHEEAEYWRIEEPLIYRYANYLSRFVAHELRSRDE